MSIIGVMCGTKDDDAAVVGSTALERAPLLMADGDRRRAAHLADPGGRL